MESIELMKKYLDRNGYDGLWNPDGECGCLVSDIAPCGGYIGYCTPGYRVDIPEKSRTEYKYEYYICKNKTDNTQHIGGTMARIDDILNSLTIEDHKELTKNLLLKREYDGLKVGHGMHKNILNITIR